MNTTMSASLSAVEVEIARPEVECNLSLCAPGTTSCLKELRSAWRAAKQFPSEDGGRRPRDSTALNAPSSCPISTLLRPGAKVTSSRAATTGSFESIAVEVNDARSRWRLRLPRRERS